MYAEGLVDGIYFALPTRAAAVQIHGRVNGFIARLFPEECRPAVALAVPGYDPDANAASSAIPDYDTHAAGHHDDNDRPWASEHPKRYLAAQIAVGTVDQALLGALKVKNAHMRTACLARNLLVVDEVHASDAYMTEILAALLDAHCNAGGYALLMSATLGSVARQRWLDESGDIGLAGVLSKLPIPPSAFGATPSTPARMTRRKRWTYPAGPSCASRLPWPSWPWTPPAPARRSWWFATPSTTPSTRGRPWRSGPGPLDKLRMNVATLLHHGRYAAGDRRRLDGRVEALLGKDSQRARHGGCVVVGTQTLEQSLDIDADLLITDLCPADVLLQRIGRLHRHTRDDRPPDYAGPRCIVLTPPGDDLSPLLDGGQDANGLGPRGYVYEDLRILQATLGLIDEYPQWQIPEMNRLLVERGDASHRAGGDRGAGRRLEGARHRGQGRRDRRLADGAQRHHPPRQVLFRGQPRGAVPQRRRAHPHPPGRRPGGHRL